jgi:hypothetical protein
MRKLTETCYLDSDKMLSAVQPMNRTDWIVLNKQGALTFGPDNKANCFKFINEFAE